MAKNTSEETIVNVAEAYTKTENFVNKNGKTISGIIGVVVLLIVAFFMYNKLVKEPNNREAAANMFMAEDDFLRDSLELSLRTEDAKFGFQEIISEYGGTPSGNLARHYAGLVYLNTGKWAEAKTELMACSFDDMLQESARLGAIGDCSVNLGEYDNAISFFNKAIAQGDNDITTPLYLKKLGLVYEKVGNASAAQDSYERIKRDFPTSVIDIDKYIARASVSS